MMAQTPAVPIDPAIAPAQPIDYPDSDGRPIADNTQQFHWIQIIQSNLAALLADDPQVFVASNLLWYPIEDSNTIRQAPDVMVVFGVPKGDRGSYRQWQENQVAPQVVFEILSPSHRVGEMLKKQMFYNRYGVEESYIYDPDRHELAVLIRGAEGDLEPINDPQDWVSPRLGIRFQLDETTLTLLRPDGQPFSSLLEERQRADRERERADRLAARLRELGIDPDTIDP